MAARVVGPYDPRMPITTTFAHTWRSALFTMLSAVPKRSRWVVAAMPVVLPALAFYVDGVLRIYFIALLPTLLALHALQAHRLVKDGERVVTLDEDGFVVEKPGTSEARMVWAAVLDVRRQYGLIVIRTTPRCVVTVPESALTAEQLTEFDAFLVRRAESAVEVVAQA